MNSVRILTVVVGSVLLSSPALARGSAPAEKAQLVLEVAPAATEVYVDGEKKGTADDLKKMVLAPGPHVLKLVYAGDEHEDQVQLRAGAKTTFSWKFEDDKKATAGSDFDFIEQQTAAALQ